MNISHLNSTTLDRIFASKRALILRGAPGIAKTALVNQYCESKGMPCVTEFLPSMDAPDLMGFLIPTKTEDGGAVARYTKPNWLRRIEETGSDVGILFFDEVLAAEHLTQKAAAPLYSERRIGEWPLPEGWAVWGSGNRTIDKAGAGKMLAHIVNKVCVLDVEPCPPSWIAWATDNDVHPMLISFAEKFPGVVFGTTPPEDPNMPRCTPRSLTYAGEVLSFGVDRTCMDLPSDEITQELVAGFIGPGASGNLFAYLKVTNELPELRDILADPQRAKVPAPERMDAHAAAAQMIIYHATPDNIERLFEYGTRLKRELQTSIAQQMLAKQGGVLLNSKCLNEWLAENAALVSSTLG